jgi:hypothetical protein
MQKKESKTNKHFYFSMTKSFIRVIGFGCLFYNDFKGAAVLLILAEGLGVVEEF